MLRFDGAAVFLRRGKLSQLRGDRDVDVKVGDMAEGEGVFVREFSARFAVRV